jgi:DHA1 family bicyclomycin/chloramphenicol resistance-like MFS transporter
MLILLISAGVFFFLPESQPPDAGYSLSAGSIIRNYLAVLKQPYFIIFTFSGALAFACLFSYIASSPAVFMEHFQLTQKQYGWLFAFLASGLILASQVNSLLLNHFTSEQLIRSALIGQNIIGLLLLTASLLHFDGFWVTICLLYPYLGSIGLIMPNATALAMRPFSQNAGSASALLGFIQMGLGSLATVLVGLLGIHRVLPMAGFILACSILGLLLITGTSSFLRNRLVQPV